MAKRHFFGGMQTVTSCISVTLVLVLLGCTVFFGQVMHELSRHMRENLVVTLLLSDDAKDSEMAKFATNLKTRPYVSESKLISREQALEEQSAAMGTDPSEFLGVNPFNASIELNLKAEYANSDSLLSVSKQLEALDIVTDVVYQKDLIDNVNDNVGRVAIVLLALAALLTVVSIVLINNTVRLSIYSRRFVIHTMRLVGASWGFIRRPFMARAFWMGICSALIAIVILIAGARALIHYDESIKAFISIENTIITASVIIAVGLLITMLCSLMTVNHFLRMRENDMY
ncbi:MAG: cell division protein FtsX [Bacteroidaceae bacterium]|nr:cell division protein FtsX [Bacteroidaceae bacterium]